MEEMISYIFYIVNNLMYPNEYDRKELMEYLRLQISDVDITSDSDHSFYVGYDKRILLSENFDFHSFNGDIENMINDILSEGEVVYLTDSEKNRITNRFIRGFNHSFPKLYRHDELESILDSNVKAIEQNELYDSRYFRDQKKIRLTNTRNSLVAFHEFVHALHTGYDEYNGKYYHGIDEGFTELATLVHKNGVINNRYCNLEAYNNGYKDLVLLTQSVCKEYDKYSGEKLLLEFLKRENIFDKLIKFYGKNKAEELLKFYEHIYNSGDIYQGNYILFYERLGLIEEFLSDFNHKKMVLKKI